MKKAVIWILAAFLSALYAPAFAAVIESHHSGSWFDSDRPGHGLSFEVVDDERLVIYWYAYHPDGTPMWLLSVANIEGDTATGDAYYFSGMAFGNFESGLLQRERWGTLSVTFLDCNSARLSYDSVVSHGGVPYGAGQVNLDRLTFIHGLQCPPPLEEGKFGNFTSGYGFPSPSGFPTDSFVLILRDGTLAYQSRGAELGYGQLKMTAENTFNFTAVTSSGVREGTGQFEDGKVALNLGELGVLSEPLDSSTYDAITYMDIAGQYVGPDAMFGGTISGQGKYEGWGIGASSVWGQVAIAEDGLNQLVATIEWESIIEDYPDGINQGLGVYDQTSGNLFFIFVRGEEVWTSYWFRSD